MADRYVRSGGGNWTASGTWELTPGGGESVAAPTAADDVYLVVGSGQLTINTNAVCRSFNCTGYTNTVTHNSGYTMTIGTSSSGPSNIGLKLVSGMTYTLGSATTSAIAFNSTSGNTETFDFADKTIGNFTLTAGKLQLLSGFTTAATVTFQAGTFDWNGKTCSIVSFSATSTGTRTLTLGAASITCSGNFDASGTNITWSTNTATLIETGAGTISLGSYNTNGLTVKITYSSTSTATITPGASGATIKNLIIAPTTSTPIIAITSGQTLTITDNFWVSTTQGAATTVTLKAVTANSQATISKSSGTVSIYDLTITDIAFTGGATWNAYNNVTTFQTTGLTYNTGYWYMDLDNGSDSNVKAYGWWKVAYTSGTGTAPSEGTVVTGGSSGSTAKVTGLVDPVEWAAGAGTLYFYAKSAAFQSESVTFSGGSFSIAGDFSVASWKTMTGGPTAARIGPGDFIRVLDSPAPVSLGSATWTDGASTVVLDSSTLCKKVDDNIGDTWTESTNVTGGTSTTRKIGATVGTFALAAGFTTGKIAFKALSGATDYSGYTGITFWFFSTIALTAGQVTVDLCSDTAGDTPVDTFNIPAVVASNWHAFTVNKGSALGSNIQSVSLNATADFGACTIRIQNINACNPGTLSLTTLIGKSSSNNGKFYAIRSIDGATVTFDNGTGAAVYGKCNESPGSATTYSLLPHTDVAVSSATTLHQLQDAGSAVQGRITLSGGWSSATNEQTGCSWISNQTDTGGYCIDTNEKSFWKFEKLGIARHGVGFNISSDSSLVYNSFFTGEGGSGGILLNTKSEYNIIDTCYVYSNNTCIYFNYSNKTKVISCLISASANYGITTAGTTSSAELINCTFNYNTSASLFLSCSGEIISFYHCLFSDSVEIVPSSGSSISKQFVSPFWSKDHDQSDNNNIGLLDGTSYVQWQTGTKHSSEPGAWQIVLGPAWTTTSLTNFGYSSAFPLKMKIAEIACAASKEVTAKVWVKKSHATNIGAKFIVYADSYVTGVSEDTATKASDTDWEELTITFTPSVASVVPIYIESWVSDNLLTSTASVYVGTVTITQVT